MQQACVFLFPAMAGFVRRDGSGDHRRRSLLRFLSGLGAAVRPPLPAAPARMGRASFQAEDDADKPARKAGMGSPGPLAAHHRPDAVACLSVLAERERLNLSGTGNTPHRYHLIAPADRYTCPQATGPHHGIWTHGPQPYLSDSFYSLEKSTDAARNPFPAVALAHGLPQGLARAGPPAKIFKHGKIISPVNSLRAVSHWIHACIRSERSILSVIHPHFRGVTYSHRIHINKPMKIRLLANTRTFYEASEYDIPAGKDRP